MQLVEATIRVNDNQKLKMVQKIEEAIVELEGKKLAVLGLTFKPKTDDMRDAPSLTIIRELAKKGVALNVYDPIGMHERRRNLLMWIPSVIVWMNTRLLKTVTVLLL